MKTREKIAWLIIGLILLSAFSIEGGRLKIGTVTLRDTLSGTLVTEKIKAIDNFKIGQTDMKDTLSGAFKTSRMIIEDSSNIKNLFVEHLGYKESIITAIGDLTIIPGYHQCANYVKNGKLIFRYEPGGGDDLFWYINLLAVGDTVQYWKFSFTEP